MLYIKNMDDLQDSIETYINENLSDGRLEHSYSVCETALNINESNNLGLEPQSIVYATLLHDSSRYMSLSQMQEILSDNAIEYNPNYTEALLHSKVSALIALLEFGITDSDILNAISYHTTGRAGMSVLERIVYTADYLEPLRCLDTADKIRHIAIDEKDFERAFIDTVIESINFVISNRAYLDPNSIAMYNYCVLNN